MGLQVGADVKVICAPGGSQSVADEATHVPGIL